jgi:hypothetical protein
MPASTALPGHGLRSEGKPFLPSTDGECWVIPYRSSGEGHGVCACGESSGVLPSNNARKRWHRQHKKEVWARGQHEETRE